jgi:hypothetical protein
VPVLALGRVFTQHGRLDRSLEGLLVETRDRCRVLLGLFIEARQLLRVMELLTLEIDDLVLEWLGFRTGGFA